MSVPVFIISSFPCHRLRYNPFFQFKNGYTIWHMISISFLRLTIDILIPYRKETNKENLIEYFFFVPDLYNVNEKESGGQGEHHVGYGKLVFTQLGKETLFFPVQPGFLPVKVKRHREFALHRKCCLNGCTALDFAGVC